MASSGPSLGAAAAAPQRATYEDLDLWHVLPLAEKTPPQHQKDFSKACITGLRHELHRFMDDSNGVPKDKVVEYLRRRRQRGDKRNEWLYAETGPAGEPDFKGPLSESISDANLLRWMRVIFHDKFRIQFTTKGGCTGGSDIVICRMRAIQGHNWHHSSPQKRGLVPVLEAMIGWHGTQRYSAFNMMKRDQGFRLLERIEGYFSLADNRIPQTRAQRDHSRTLRPFTKEEIMPYVYDNGGSIDTEIAIDFDMGRKRSFLYWQTLNQASLVVNEHDLDYFIMIVDIHTGELIFGYDTQHEEELHRYYIQREHFQHIPQPERFANLPPPSPPENLSYVRRTCGTCNQTLHRLCHICPYCSTHLLSLRGPPVAKTSPPTRVGSDTKWPHVKRATSQTPASGATATASARGRSAPAAQKATPNPERVSKQSTYMDFQMHCKKFWKRATAGKEGWPVYESIEALFCNNTVWADKVKQNGETIETIQIADEFMRMRQRYPEGAIMDKALQNELVSAARLLIERRDRIMHGATAADTTTNVSPRGQPRQPNPRQPQTQQDKRQHTPPTASPIGAGPDWIKRQKLQATRPPLANPRQPVRQVSLTPRGSRANSTDSTRPHAPAGQPASRAKSQPSRVKPTAKVWKPKPPYNDGANADVPSATAAASTASAMDVDNAADAARAAKQQDLDAKMAELRSMMADIQAQQTELNSSGSAQPNSTAHATTAPQQPRQRRQPPPRSATQSDTQWNYQPQSHTVGAPPPQRQRDRTRSRPHQQHWSRQAWK